MRIAVLPLIVAAAAAGPAAASEAVLDLLHFDGFETATPGAFRLGALMLRDPHVFVPVPLGPVTLCTDATDLADVGLNAQIAASLAADADANGRYDTNPLLLFEPLRGDGLPGHVSDRSGDCSVAPPLQCVPAAASAPPRAYRRFALAGSDHCLEPLAGTTSTWTSGAPVPQPGGSCYATTAADLVLNTGAVAIPLFDTRFGAPLPATSGSTGGGLLRGFLRASDAAVITVPVNGANMSLASLLPGGTGSCRANLPGGVDSWNGESGWWFYFEYRQDAASL
ncbi:MAG: hypothetical protein BGP24_21745 [Lysobacterales bacterium 69-70]|nr:hypothetical protein [Xanthomonadaceae bacterium]ODU36395.1 MAG: hypothetical protein ABS97_00465 [Xanthomonadaceae bacterium SCN 69-320]ODV21742.1 MAG: hypothetical protein ABT27_04125 [Xanthomonadaceae bacterium SCN 69-25]OJY95942.1 MAG: hypothetical protein BGP24_21745 [Xanthomonadales bacterium 69-70]